MPPPRCDPRPVGCGAVGAVSFRGSARAPTRIPRAPSPRAARSMRRAPGAGGARIPVPPAPRSPPRRSHRRVPSRTLRPLLHRRVPSLHRWVPSLRPRSPPAPPGPLPHPPSPPHHRISSAPSAPSCALRPLPHPRSPPAPPGPLLRPRSPPAPPGPLRTLGPGPSAVAGGGGSAGSPARGAPKHALARVLRTCPGAPGRARRHDHGQGARRGREVAPAGAGTARGPGVREARRPRGRGDRGLPPPAPRTPLGFLLDPGWGWGGP